MHPLVGAAFGVAFLDLWVARSLSRVLPLAHDLQIIAEASRQSSPAGSEGGMTKTYRDWSTDQAYLFPPSPHDWLPQGDLVYFLLDTVATLDLSPIFAHYQRELRGQSAVPPPG